MRYKLDSREPVSHTEIQQALDLLNFNLGKRIAKFGNGSHTSKHETLGIIQEEVYELLQATHQNDVQSCMDECLDIAVACIWGYASLKKLQQPDTHISIDTEAHT